MCALQIINTTNAVRNFLVEPNTRDVFAALSSDVLSSDLAIDVAPISGKCIPFDIRVYKIEDELVFGYFNGVTLIIDEGFRGLWTTGALEHLAGTPIQLASLWDIVGSDIFKTRTPEDHLNETPSVVIKRLGGTTPDVSPNVRDRMLLKTYGGKDSADEFNEELASGVFSALQDRTNEAYNTQTLSGIIGSIQLESGQEIVDDSMRPVWPIVLSFGNINAV